MNTTVIIISAIVLIGILFIILSYNKIKKLMMNVERSFSDLDAFLMKRVDQLDNLIQTARVATDKEIEMMENVTGLRSGIMNAHNMDDKLKAHMNLQREMPAVMVSLERYPDVKFNENYLHIQRSINEIEEQIQAARRNFNSHTTKYNTAISVFPQNMLAGMFGFTKKPLFEAPPEKRENVDVKSLFNR
ncbi:MAG TPA: LemA family protein [Candidatus Avamphibacillus intestinigallinarum]|nr:LemA family protein [Candidatus Avamphibacillus intestinigallinarum]